MLRNIFGGDKIKVELIEAVSNEPFGIVKILWKDLPESFDKPTTLHIEGADWTVEKADPANAQVFRKTGKLTVWLTKIHRISPQNIRYSMPTISGELPAFSYKTFFTEATHTIQEDDWRQFEFLSSDYFPVVQEEMTKVEAVLFPDDKDIDPVDGFNTIHIRAIPRRTVSIPLSAFLENVPILKKGNLAIQGYNGYVENGFSFYTTNHVYYGTIEGDSIVELCLGYYESMDDEINMILEEYKLIFAGWYRGSIAVGSWWKE